MASKLYFNFFLKYLFSIFIYNLENKNNNIFLGKIEKMVVMSIMENMVTFEHVRKTLYIPKWLKPEEVTLDMAQRLIAYKQKICEEWLEKTNNNNNNESDDESSEDTTKIKLK
jgi:hypothetical protein